MKKIWIQFLAIIFIMMCFAMVGYGHGNTQDERFITDIIFLEIGIMITNIQGAREYPVSWGAVLSTLLLPCMTAIKICFITIN